MTMKETGMNLDECKQCIKRNNHTELCNMMGDFKKKIQVAESEIECLQELLLQCIPFVSDSLDDPTNKASAKAKIRSLINKIRNTVAGRIVSYRYDPPI